MAITRDDVLHVAKLGRLQLAEDEIDRMRIDLERILGYVAQLNELDTSTIPPTAHVFVDVAPLRADVVHEGLSTEAALAEAPRHRDSAFAVPAFVDEV